ncbi:MAG TPA: hypothetical protein DCQ06_10845, partial [Myxococcales bacterium]|nr:hypothetical protein [Myxococcales bacterium]
MRHQHYTRYLRLGMLAGLLTFAACAEEPTPAPTAGLLTDYAAGVDASFGVETFNLGDPSITVTSPKNYAQWVIAKGGTQGIKFEFSTANWTPGKVNCYLDGKLDGASTGTSYTFSKVPMGFHTVSCVLFDSSYNEITSASARGVRRVSVTPPCQISDDCDDGLACSNEFCIGGTCKFEPITNCCGSKFDCVAGEACNNPNTSNSQCTVCQTDKDCDDSNICTTGKCDLSGPKGVCNFPKLDPECCMKDDKECDDGKTCTIDTCDVNKQKCEHTKPAGVCCTDSECVTDDKCLVGACVAYSCRFEPNTFRKDCCSAGTNTACDDKNYCTIDKCDAPQTEGWTKCSHNKDPSKPNCCSPQDSCDDGDDCTWDYCQDFQCKNVALKNCCKNTKDCDDGSLCTTDSCVKTNPLDQAGKCLATKVPGCCEEQEDCEDGKFCTYDVCDVDKNLCSHPKKWAACCDADSECSDGKFCTNDVCVNHACVGIPDKFKPNCCESTSDCNDGLPCTIDSCDTDLSQCKYVDNGDPTCCNGPDDCDDKDCTTIDFCDANNKCAFKIAPDKCKNDSQCDDGNACTLDTCVSDGTCGKCTFTPQPGCCLADFQCQDDNPCTINTCGTDNKCAATKKAGCCLDDKDALTACDDGNAC